MLDRLNRATVEIAIAAAVFTLVAGSLPLFQLLSPAQRLATITAAAIAVAALAYLRGREFFRLRLSGSTVALIIAAACALAALIGNGGAGIELREVLFFGLLPLASVTGFIWAVIEFFRFRTLQFAVELSLNLAGSLLFLSAASQL
jgi:hypothetical protein